MKKRLLQTMLITGLLIPINLLAQNKQESALAKGRQAVELEDQGKYDEAIALLKESQQLDPGNIEYPYELGYAYYHKQDYTTCIQYLQPLTNHEKTYDQIFQLLGNCYDVQGNHEKALEVYDAGLKKFPHSGKLFLEKGTVFYLQKDYTKALTFYEEGIEADPAFPSNYYRACQIYCNSSEEVWGMIYGELFINLERNTARTAEISALLYNTYKSEIKFSSDTSMSVSFSKYASIDASSLKNKKAIILPFGIGVYEPTLMMSLIGIQSINLNSLDRIRTQFVDFYYKNGFAEKYPNVLFEYQKRLKDAGHLEAYNHWLLMKGDEAAFKQWKATNASKFEAFATWFGENKLTLNAKHRFYRFQY